MAFGLTFPFGYTPLFDGLELFTQPRFVRRSFVHPRAPVHHRPHRGGFGRRARCGPFDADLLDLLIDGNDFFLDHQDEDLIEHPTTEQITETAPTNTKTSEIAVAQPSSVVEPSTSAVVSAPTTNTTVAPLPKKMGEVSSKKTENGVKFEIAFPGLTLADLKLDLDTKKKALIVKADKTFEEKHEDEYGSRVSYKKISFHRALPLETLPTASDIHADFADGSLHITVATKAIEAAPEITPLTIGSQSTPIELTTTTPAPEPATASASSSMDSDEATVEDAEE